MYTNSPTKEKMNNWTIVFSKSIKYDVLKKALIFLQPYGKGFVLTTYHARCFGNILVHTVLQKYLLARKCSYNQNA